MPRRHVLMPLIVLATSWASTAHGHSADEPEATFEAAREAYAQGDFNRALPLYEQACDQGDAVAQGYRQGTTAAEIGCQLVAIALKHTADFLALPSQELDVDRGTGELVGTVRLLADGYVAAGVLPHPRKFGRRGLNTAQLVLLVSFISRSSLGGIGIHDRAVVQHI